MQIDKKKVGLRLSSLRKENNLSMDDLAKAISVAGRSTINGWEKGRSLPTNTFIEKLANFFEVPVDFIKYGSLKEFTMNLLKTEIWDSEDLYSELQKNIWTYVTKTQHDEINMIEDLEMGFVTTLSNTPFSEKPTEEEIENMIKESKKRAVNKAINSSIDDLMNMIEEENASYNKNKIIDIANYFFEQKIKYILDTFEGKLGVLSETIDKIINNGGFSFNKYKNYDDFEKSISKDDFRYKLSKKDKINDYYDGKITDMLMEFRGNLSELKFDYEKTKNDNNIQ
ncbi:XRE family transcriptional regulator [Apilactobacillus micheneri]|uniref:XRE family transcriptional regulator n=1 Tax=Apilactobacillus micheneri TaxID=1899430 RepID=A0ABY2Z324_9LACO|nr:helix-turn-helix transcriptional regulator [Apilactobacillus micheneri]TPR26464.1 XRE family transcriptional regulator [Apilactobacillus micheneri]TPR27218.1 XRE family transcriptional regulator [Apilactobacillus micheneri]TPR27465.1 XRE family transcriptional regulator [Apilactobacillus micheneri]TPR31981.1 XRE family transcriptional regulator [Apilactobacillus micheneri]TPR32385.1 XRE family transcriptional regulator [Apilactobacillus micheneri]